MGDSSPSLEHLQWSQPDSEPAVALPTSMPAAIIAGTLSQMGWGPAQLTSAHVTVVARAHQKSAHSRRRGYPGNTWLGWLGGFALLGPTGHFLQKATSSRLGDVTDLANTGNTVQ